MTELLRDGTRLVADSIRAWGEPHVERACFGTGEPDHVVALVDAHLRATLGAGIRGYVFYACSVGSTHGVELEDGRRVVLKARPPASYNPDLVLGELQLTEGTGVLRWLYARGYPCAETLVGPRPLGVGLATVESYLRRGDYCDGFDPDGRRRIAGELAGLIRELRGYPGSTGSLHHFVFGEKLYPTPHSRLFDFEKTAPGAEWIDAFARRAKAVSSPAGARVLGHGDWRVEHLRFEGERLVATYDWDSLATKSEAELVGVAACSFTADWDRDNVRRIPEESDLRAFVGDYEAERGEPFTRDERRALFATSVYHVAYGARCTHALGPQRAQDEWPPDSWPNLLRVAGDSLLREAGASAAR